MDELKKVLLKCKRSILFKIQVPPKIKKYIGNIEDLTSYQNIKDIHIQEK